MYVKVPTPFAVPPLSTPVAAPAKPLVASTDEALADGTAPIVYLAPSFTPPMATVGATVSTLIPLTLVSGEATRLQPEGQRIHIGPADCTENVK